MCAIALILERNEGLIDRTWVAGVNVTEIIIAQVFTQFFILLVQMSLLIVVLLFGLKVRDCLLSLLIRKCIDHMYIPDNSLGDHMHP